MVLLSALRMTPRNYQAAEPPLGPCCAGRHCMQQASLTVAGRIKQSFCKQSLEPPSITFPIPQRVLFCGSRVEISGNLGTIAVLCTGPTRRGGLLQWGDVSGNMRRPELPPGVIALQDSWVPTTEDADAAPSLEVRMPCQYRIDPSIPTELPDATACAVIGRTPDAYVSIRCCVLSKSTLGRQCEGAQAGGNFSAACASRVLLSPSNMGFGPLTADADGRRVPQTTVRVRLGHSQLTRRCGAAGGRCWSRARAR